MFLSFILFWFSSSASAGVSPVYPDRMKCGKISSGFGAIFDLDGSRRDVRHEGIDFGDLGDTVIAPADGSVLGVWAVTHNWGTNWNLLIRHTPDDLNLVEPGSLYVSEFNHLQSRNMPPLKPGDKLIAGQVIGQVRHPGDNPEFTPEVHLELYRLPAAVWNATEWRDVDGRRFWWNDAAVLVDPLRLLTHQDAPGQIQFYTYDAGARKKMGFVYLLLCF